MVPLDLDRPYWVDDPDLDLDFHIRALALPAPGDAEQLGEQVARIIARPLDRSRPLWEWYVITGLEDGRVGVLTKLHHATIDGASGVELIQLLLETDPDAAARPEPGARAVGAGTTRRARLALLGRTAARVRDAASEDARAPGAAAAHRGPAHRQPRHPPDGGGGHAGVAGPPSPVRRAPGGHGAAHADRGLGAPDAMEPGGHRPPPLRVPHAAPRRRPGGQARVRRHRQRRRARPVRVGAADATSPTATCSRSSPSWRWCRSRCASRPRPASSRTG